MHYGTQTKIAGKTFVQLDGQKDSLHARAARLKVSQIITDVELVFHN